MCSDPLGEDPEAQVDISTTVFMDDIAHKCVSRTADGMVKAVNGASQDLDECLYTVGGAQNTSKQNVVPRFVGVGAHTQSRRFTSAQYTRDVAGQ
eukprot:3711265-Pyramimonas_sp.AAC.1